MTKKIKKEKKEERDPREVPVSFFTRDDVKAALEADAGKSSRSRSRQVHVILCERYGLTP